MVYFVELRRKGIIPSKTALVIKRRGGSLLTDTYCNLLTSGYGDECI